MRKPIVLSIVFVVLALVLSTWVYVASSREQKSVDLQRRMSQPYFQNQATRPINTPPVRSTSPSGQPASLENVQRNIKIIEEIKKLNRLNAEARPRLEKQAEAPSPKTK
jgi:hypothetical protein